MDCENEVPAGLGDRDQRECDGCVLRHLLRWLEIRGEAQKGAQYYLFPAALTKYPDKSVLQRVYSGSQLEVQLSEEGLVASV